MFNYDKNEEAYTTFKQRLNITAGLCLAAVFYPLAHSNVSGLFYVLGTVITPLISAALAIIYSFAIIEGITAILGPLAASVQNKLSSLQEKASINNDVYVKPKLEAIKHSASYVYNAMPTLPTFSSVKAMLFSQPAAPTTRTEERNANTLTELTPRNQM